MPVTRTDTITRRDTVVAEIPITQKVYADSSYKAWVSGYLANLDSIDIYQRTITVKEVKKARRLNLGISAGYGVTGSGKLEPFVGIGMTYNFSDKKWYRR